MTTETLTVEHEGVTAVWKGGMYADVFMPTVHHPKAEHAIDVLWCGYAAEREEEPVTAAGLLLKLTEWVRENYATYWENA